MTPQIRFEHVYKRYNLGLGKIGLRGTVAKAIRRAVSRKDPDADRKTLWALKDVSFEVEKGKALGLIGPNGAGKTTALKILAKITQPTSGLVELKGRVSALIELGAGFHPDLTGRENIYLNGSILGLTQREIARKFDRIVDFSGLERFIETPVKRYSSGMYVRLAFSVAAHVEPDVLLVDEVLAVGDAQFRQKCAQRIDALQKQGTTIVFVAHNLFLVKSVCDEAIFMTNGIVRERGDVVEAIKAYESWIHQNQTLAFESQNDILDPSLAVPVVLNLIEVLPVDGSNQQGGFSYRDAAEIRVHYTVAQPVDDPILVLRINRADGVTCAMIRTCDYGYSLDRLEGEGVVSVGVDPLQLSGGAYSIEAKLMTGAIDGMPLAKLNSSWFEVSGKSLSQEEASGVYVPQVSWVRLAEQHPSNGSAGELRNGSSNGSR